MVPVGRRLSLAEFQVKYGQEERSYEYWNGEAVPKAMPTWVHGVLQAILCRLLWQAGYKSGSEVELRIDPDFRPKPDVIATSGKVERPYPTKAVEIAIEILSLEDAMSRVIEKCRYYVESGFQYVYLVDPESRQIYRATGQGLETTDRLVGVPADRIWAELDQELS